MTRHAEVVVVGAGVMGAATARALSRAGREVMLIEQHQIGHENGSSHGSSRIVRLSYHDARWVGLAQQAFPRWRDLEAEAGASLLALHGGLDFGPAVPRHREALRRAGAAFEMLDGDALDERFPFLNAPDGAEVLYHPQAGIVRADLAWRALVDSAVGHGCRLVDHTRVRRLRAVGDAVELDLGTDTVVADTAVVTAGAWAAGLLAGVGITLDVAVTRETIAFFRLPAGATPSIVDWTEPAVYALDAPGWGGEAVVKAGEHHAGPRVDPDAPGGPDPECVDRLTTWARRRFAEVDPEVLAAQTCLYTTAPDHEFVLERHGRIVVGSPCSGHGFKFAPLVGERLAQLTGV